MNPNNPTNWAKRAHERTERRDAYRRYCILAVVLSALFQLFSALSNVGGSYEPKMEAQLTEEQRPKPNPQAAMSWLTASWLTGVIAIVCYVKYERA